MSKYSEIVHCNDVLTFRTVLFPEYKDLSSAYTEEEYDMCQVL